MRIVSFIGYRASKAVVIRGQMLLQAYKKPLRESTPWQNFRSNLSRLFAKGIKGQHLTITFDNQEQHVRTNKKGFFQATFISKQKGWQEARITHRETQETVHESVLCSFTGYGLISDVDDTIMTSHATNFWKKLYLVLFKNSLTRKEVKGMSAFLRFSKTQVFYVSNSSWELYDFITEFCVANKFPQGPFLLSNKKILSIRYRRKNKTSRIEEILTGYPKQQFFLVGDDGQHDPLIYNKIAQRYPDQIKAIFIRANNKHSAQLARNILQGSLVPFFVEEQPSKFSAQIKPFL